MLNLLLAWTDVSESCRHSEWRGWGGGRARVGNNNNNKRKHGTWGSKQKSSQLNAHFPQNRGGRVSWINESKRMTAGNLTVTNSPTVSLISQPVEKPALSDGQLVLKSATILSLEIRREPREPLTAQNSKAAFSQRLF